MILDEQLQPNPIMHTYSTDWHQVGDARFIRKQTYKVNDSVRRRPVPANDPQRTAIRRSYLRGEEQTEDFVTKTSLRISPMVLPSVKWSNHTQQPFLYFSVADCCSTIYSKAKFITRDELSDLLNQLTLKLSNVSENDLPKEKQQLPFLVDILEVLFHIPSSTLSAISQNEFFTLLRLQLIDFLQQWSRGGALPEVHLIIFHHVTKLIELFIDNIDEDAQLPLWLSDLTLLQTIAQCLLNIASSDALLLPHNKHHFKYFTRLIDAYIHYQQRLTQPPSSDQDKLMPLVDPILRCLTSNHYIDTLTDMPVDQSSMGTKQKFFLVKCPTFLTSYTGSALVRLASFSLRSVAPLL